MEIQKISISLNITLTDGTTVSHPAFDNKEDAKEFIDKYDAVNATIIADMQEEE